MRLGVIVACWKRPRLTALCLRRIRKAAYRSSQTVELLAVVSRADDERVAEQAGWETLWAANKPLGRKHNIGARALRGRVGALIVLGSDNWVCDQFFDRWFSELQERPVVGIRDVWQVGLHIDRALHFRGYPGKRSGESLGAGRGIHADVLNKLDWTPWPGGRNRALDAGMRRRIKSVGHDTLGRIQKKLGVRLLGIKGPTTISPMRAYRGYPTTRKVTRKAALRGFPEAEVKDLEALARSVRAGGSD